jgi:16S rRNA (uracil1498-N3)-methyltransferase
VRRTRVGEHLLVGDGQGRLAAGEVVETGRDVLVLRVIERCRVPVPSPRVTLAQALVKGDRGELAVELATEAGVDAVLPWRAARCVARWDAGPRGAKALDRWRSAVLAAAKQSRRAWLPDVAEPLDTASLARRCADADVALVLHESADTPMAELAGALSAAAEVLLVVGPEGGLTDDELKLLSAEGAFTVRLGPTVLRASSAAAVALGALGALTGRWSTREKALRYPDFTPRG